MNQYLVAYRPPDSIDILYTVADWPTIEHMLRTNEEVGTTFRIWILNGFGIPSPVRIHAMSQPSGTIYCLTDKYGQITD